MIVAELCIWWAVPGVLAGTQLPFVHPARRLNQGGLLQDYDDDLPLLYEIGIRAVVCLLNIPSDSAVYETAGFSFCCLPVSDGRAPTFQQVLTFFDFIQSQRQEHRPVVVHCEAGLGRTGTLLASYLISQGTSASNAIISVRSIQPGSIETNEQICFLEDLEQRLNPGRSLGT